MLTNNFEQLSSVLGEDLGKLFNVVLVHTRDLVTPKDLLNGRNLEALCLSFDDGLLTVRALGVDDTVEVELGCNEEFTMPERSDLSDRAPWNVAIGKYLWEVWALTNSRNYLDAIQFEFGLAGGEGVIRLQLEAAASRFRAFSVHPQDRR